MKCMKRSGTWSWSMHRGVTLRRHQGEWRQYILLPWWLETGKNRAWHMCFYMMWIERWNGSTRMSFYVKSIWSILLDVYGILRYRRRVTPPGPTVAGFARLSCWSRLFLALFWYHIFHVFISSFFFAHHYCTMYFSSLFWK